MAKQAKTAAGPTTLVLQQDKSVVQTETVNIHGDLPDLGKARIKDVNLALEYWTPQEEGESKLLIFMHVVQEDQIPDFNDPKNLVKRDCAYFIEQTEQGFQILRNASSRLVSIARHFLEGEVYQITFKGMRPNKTNSNKSNYWAIQPVEFAA